jgi:uncharacterized membrane protein
MNAIKPVGAMIAVATCLDMLWLTFRNSYHEALFRSIQQAPLTIRILPAIGIYLLLPIALYLGAVQPALSVLDGVRRGAIVGAILYAFYDLTNYATLNKWTLEMALTDTLWGTSLSALVAGVGVYFKK